MHVWATVCNIINAGTYLPRHSYLPCDIRPQKKVSTVSNRQSWSSSESLAKVKQKAGLKAKAWVLVGSVSHNLSHALPTAPCFLPYHMHGPYLLLKRAFTSNDYLLHLMPNWCFPCAALQMPLGRAHVCILLLWAYT